jgi:hypothetical protein
MAFNKPIPPAPAKDIFKVDFTDAIGATGALTSVVWTCEVSPLSTLLDPTPEARIIGTPIFDNHNTSVLCGNMIDGVIYRLTVTATAAPDGQVFVEEIDIECTSSVSITDPILTIEGFRQTFPAFRDPVNYPDEAIGFWINQAINFSPININRWGQFYDIGLRYYIAHNLALDRVSEITVSGGGAPVGSGVANSKSVGGVSISYDVEFGSEEKAGHWNLTTFGTRFIRLLRMAGSAPVQL